MTEPLQPPAMSKAQQVTYAILLPAALLALVFWPAGTIRWVPGWIFIAVLVLGFAASAVWIAKANPIIYRARSRFQPGAEGPLALRSYWGLVPAAAAGALLIVRTAWEDRLLKAKLGGYREFAERTRYRILPFVW